MSVTVVTPPIALPVTLIEAKAELRVLHSEEDAKITRLIKAATAHVESILSMSLMERTLKLTLDAFSDAIELPMGPVTQVLNVEYYDAEGASQTLAASTYSSDLTSSRQWVLLNDGASWPATLNGVNAVSVTYKAGFVALPERYEDLKAAILTLVRHQFDNPSGNIPPLVDAMLQPHRPMLV